MMRIIGKASTDWATNVQAQLVSYRCCIAVCANPGLRGRVEKNHGFVLLWGRYLSAAEFSFHDASSFQALCRAPRADARLWIGCKGREIFYGFSAWNGACYFAILDLTLCFNRNFWPLSWTTWFLPFFLEVVLFVLLLLQLALSKAEMLRRLLPNSAQSFSLKRSNRNFCW